MAHFALETSIFKYEISIGSKLHFSKTVNAGLQLKMGSVPLLWYQKYLISIYVDKEGVCFEIIQSL